MLTIAAVVSPVLEWQRPESFGTIARTVWLAGERPYGATHPLRTRTHITRTQMEVFSWVS